MLYMCIFIPNFLVQALMAAKPDLQKKAVAIVEGKPPLLRVVAVNQRAAALGVNIGSAKMQAEIAGAHVLLRAPEFEEAAHTLLVAVARNFSPRIEDRA